MPQQEPERSTEKEVKVTAKRKKIILLPELRDHVYIPNRLTNARYDYSLIQERIFNFILFYLQEAIRRNMNGLDYMQLEMFREDQQVVLIDIPLYNIASPAQYDEIRESARQMAGIVVAMKSTNEKTGEKFLSYQGLFSRILVPVEAKRSSYITVEVKKEIARLLIEVDKNIHGKPKNYTGFILQIATSAKNKYTPRIYKLISSWKEKGGFFMSLDEFRDWLQLGDKYQEYKELKKRILLPVQKELMEQSDCWFNCADKTFEKRDGKKVVGLHFKVITPEINEIHSKQVDYIISMLRNHFSLNPDHIKQLQPVFKADFDAAKIQYKILHLHQHVKENKGQIGNVQAYVVRSLLNEFTEEKNS